MQYIFFSHLRAGLNLNKIFTVYSQVQNRLFRSSLLVGFKWENEKLRTHSGDCTELSLDLSPVLAPMAMARLSSPCTKN